MIRLEMFVIGILWPLLFALVSRCLTEWLALRRRAEMSIRDDAVDDRTTSAWNIVQAWPGQGGRPGIKLFLLSGRAFRRMFAGA